MKNRGRDAQNMNPTTQLFRAAGIGVLVSLVTILLLLVLSALVFTMAGSISELTAGIITVVIAAAGGFSGGYTATRILKRAGLLTGFLTAFVVSIILFFAGLFLSDNSVQLTNLIKQGILLLTGICGGVLGVNHKEKRK